MPDFVSKIITNPLVLIGLLLTVVTLDGVDHTQTIELFLEGRTYRNLIIGAIIYVAIFDRKYTKGRKKIALMDNVRAVIGASFVIFISWLLTVGIFVQFQVRGERIKNKIYERYAGQSYNNWKIEENGVDICKIAKDVNFEIGKSYLITVYSKDVVTVDEYGGVPDKHIMDKKSFQTFIEMLKLRKE